jgi:hypothetical protein
MKKLLLPVAAAAAMAVASLSAQAAFLPFTVTEGVVPGAGANELVAGKLNGTFTEAVTITGAASFAASAFAQFGQYVGVNGEAVASQLGSFFPQQYGLYAVFSAAGSFVGGSFTGNSGKFTLYVDPNSNTVRNPGVPFVGTADPALLNTADDIEVGSTSTLTSGKGELDPNPPNAFDFIFDEFTLTAFGMTYFTKPDPFYMMVRSNGDTDGALVPPVGGTGILTGDVSAQFIPEPGTLALVGLALAGVGVARRRKAA